MKRSFLLEINRSSPSNTSNRLFPLVFAPKQSGHRHSHSHHHHHHSHPHRPHSWLPYLPTLSLLSFIPNIFGPEENPTLSPHEYTTHKIHSIRRLTPEHVLIRIELSARSRALFRSGSSTCSSPSSPSDQTTQSIAIHHILLKSPSLQIERPYTPINDPSQDGHLDLVVKRVRGGEVGRYLHELREGDPLEIRGPGLTCALPVPTSLASTNAGTALTAVTHGTEGEEEGGIEMIGTGTGIAPFMQLLAKLSHSPGSPSTPTSVPASPSTSSSTSISNPISRTSTQLPTLTLTQYLPSPSKVDLAETHPFLPFLRETYGPVLSVRRVRAGGGRGWDGEQVAEADQGKEQEKEEGRTIWGWFSRNNQPDSETTGRQSNQKATDTGTGTGTGNGGKKVFICLPRALTVEWVGKEWIVSRSRRRAGAGGGAGGDEGEVKLGGVLGRSGYRGENVVIL